MSRTSGGLFERNMLKLCLLRGGRGVQPTFFNILPEIFRICLKVYFALKLGADFYLALRKNLAAKFRHLLEFGRQRLKNVARFQNIAN